VASLKVRRKPVESGVATSRDVAAEENPNLGAGAAINSHGGTAYGPVSSGYLGGPGGAVGASGGKGVGGSSGANGDGEATPNARVADCLSKGGNFVLSLALDATGASLARSLVRLTPIAIGATRDAIMLSRVDYQLFGRAAWRSARAARRQVEALAGSAGRVGQVGGVLAIRDALGINSPADLGYAVAQALSPVVTSVPYLGTGIAGVEAGFACSALLH